MVAPEMGFHLPAPPEQLGEEPSDRREDEEDDAALAIDPALLDEANLDSIEVAEESIDHLEATIFLNAQPAGATTNTVDEEDAAAAGGLVSAASLFGTGEALDEESTRLLLGQDGLDEAAATSAASTTAAKTANGLQDWINHCARFNVVNCKCFATCHLGWSTGAPKPAAMYGNSRDDPSPYAFTCRTEGCTFQHIVKNNLLAHEVSCTKARAEAKENTAKTRPRLKCAFVGCDFETTAGPSGLAKHEAATHKWTPRPCGLPGAIH